MEAEQSILIGVLQNQPCVWKIFCCQGTTYNNKFTYTWLLIQVDFLYWTCSAHFSPGLVEFTRVLFYEISAQTKGIQFCFFRSYGQPAMPAVHTSYSDQLRHICTSFQCPQILVPHECHMNVPFELVLYIDCKLCGIMACIFSYFSVAK